MRELIFICFRAYTVSLNTFNCDRYCAVDCGPLCIFHWTRTGMKCNDSSRTYTANKALIKTNLLLYWTEMMWEQLFINVFSFFVVHVKFQPSALAVSFKLSEFNWIFWNRCALYTVLKTGRGVAHLKHFRWAFFHSPTIFKWQALRNYI